MINTYNLFGMTCSSCEAKVRSALLNVSNVKDVKVSKEDNIVKIQTETRISILDLQNALESKYKISANEISTTKNYNSYWLDTYKPVILIFSYIFCVTAVIEIMNNNIDFVRWMRHFMSGFFLTFSFFKLINLKGFRNSYMMYDIIAQKFPNWSYIYAFTELFLGILFLLNFNPTITCGITFIIMTVSIIGVLKSVLNKKEIKCACLGDVFNLPMSTVTIIEDGLMIIMSLIMLVISLR